MRSLPAPLPPELNNKIGDNCAMSQDDCVLVAIILVLVGLWPGEMHGTQCSNGSFVNMLLTDFVSLTNLTTVYTLNKKPSNRGALPVRLDRGSLPASPSFFLRQMFFSPCLRSSNKCGARTESSFAAIWWTLQRFGFNSSSTHFNGLCRQLNSIICCNLADLAVIWL
jgi:hypothetical protein